MLRGFFYYTKVITITKVEEGFKAVIAFIRDTALTSSVTKSVKTNNKSKKKQTPLLVRNQLGGKRMVKDSIYNDNILRKTHSFNAPSSLHLFYVVP